MKLDPYYQMRWEVGDSEELVGLPCKVRDTAGEETSVIVKVGKIWRTDASRMEHLAADVWPPIGVCSRFYLEHLERA